MAQYAPQLVQTYRSRLVGALSIGTMVIQVPGAVLFILSLTSRPGVDWTSWMPYAVTATMQAALLVCFFPPRLTGRCPPEGRGGRLMRGPRSLHQRGARPGTRQAADEQGLCVAWKRRQKREGIDDFGHKLSEGGDVTAGERDALLG